MIFIVKVINRLLTDLILYREILEFSEVYEIIKRKNKRITRD